MDHSKHVPMTLSVPKRYRDILRMMAAEQNLENPDLVTSASTIAREIVCRYLDEASEGNNNLTKGGFDE
jgi:hypothetical protein